MIYCYFLAVWILTASAVSGQSTQYGLLGETVTFRTDFTDPPDDILWKHNGNKVVQFDGNQQTEYSQFQKRITLDWHSADLEINQLTHSDSGQYELDAAKKDGLTRLNFKLEVLDRVTKTTITCNMRDGSSSDKSGSEATLMCSADPLQSLNYEWSQPGKIQPGQILTIPLGTEHDDKVYSCTASNQLSKEIATFTAKDCYPVGASVGLITGVVIGGIVILVCVLGAVFCAVKHKACFAKKEKTDVEQQPHSKPLIQREETMPSSQPLRRFAEIVKNHNFDHNDEKHNELDLGTRESKESEEDKFVTALEYPNNADRASTNQPSLPLLNKAAVVGEDLNSDQVTGEKKEENESDDMIKKKGSPTIPEKTGLENNKGKPLKVGPAVGEKPPSIKIRKVQAHIREDKVSECGNLEEHSGATESDLQSATASQKPGNVKRRISNYEAKQKLTEKKADEKEHLATEATSLPSPAQAISPIPPSMTPADENKEQKEVGIADQVTGGTKEETEKEKENASGDVRKEDESPAIPGQTVADDTENLATETTSTPSMTPADENKEQKEVGISDQVTGGTKEETEKEKEKENASGDVRKEDESPAIPGQTGNVKRRISNYEAKQKPTVLVKKGDSE